MSQGTSYIQIKIYHESANFRQLLTFGLEIYIWQVKFLETGNVSEIFFTDEFNFTLELFC